MNNPNFITLDKVSGNIGLTVFIRVEEIVTITQASELERMNTKFAKSVVKLKNGDSIIVRNSIGDVASELTNIK